MAIQKRDLTAVIGTGITTLLFDLDGTLLDSNGIWDAADDVFLSRHDLAYSKEYHAGVAHTTLQESARFTKEFFHMEESAEDIIAEWLSIIKDSYDAAKLKPDAKNFLQQCRDAGYKLAIFTSCVQEHCQAALQANDIAECFDKIIHSNSLCMEKDSPEAFLAASKLLGAGPEAVAFFDDSLANCRAAKTAGMTVVKVRDDRKLEPEPDTADAFDACIESFAELLQAETT